MSMLTQDPKTTISGAIVAAGGLMQIFGVSAKYGPLVQTVGALLLGLFAKDGQSGTGS